MEECILILARNLETGLRIGFAADLPYPDCPYFWSDLEDLRKALNDGDFSHQG
jgi:hypothetical protein